MKSIKPISNIAYKIANNEDYLDICLCANEYIEIINHFKEKFLNKELSVLMVYYNKILSGILVAEDKSNKVNSIEKIVPSICINLIFINPVFRKKYLGKRLLRKFLNIQRENGFALIYIKIPQNNKAGIDFFCKNNFYKKKIVKNKVILEFNLWNDFGLRDCQLIEENLNDDFP